MLFGLALLAPPVHAEEWAHGETIDKAAYADLTPEGLDAVAQVIPALLPLDFPIPDTSDAGGIWCVNYEYGLSNASADIQVTGATITPSNGVLDVTANLLVSLNDPSNPFSLMYELLCLDDTCAGYVDAFPVTVTTTMALEVVDDGAGGRVLDATVGAIDVQYDLTNEDIHLDGCSVGDVEEVLNWFGLSLYDLVLDQLDGILRDAISDVGPTLEETLEEAFASASVNQELDLNGTVAQVSLQPEDVDITPAGVRVQLAGSLTADIASCVAAFDPGGSLRTPTAPPDIGTVPSGVGDDYHVALSLSDDFANQAMYALWRGGLLCYALGPDGSFPLDTSILAALSGDAFAELFPESTPLTLQTAPQAPPTVRYDGEHAVDLQLDRLGLELYAELDGRQAKMLTVDLEGTVGADLAFDGATGVLGVVVDLDPSALTPSVGYNEFFPDADETILSAFSSVFGSLVGTVVGGFLDDLSFALPAFSGIGLTELQTASVGADADWMGAYAWVGPVTYAAADGCGSDGGCGGGCSGGCDANPGAPVAFWTGIAGLLLLRRRR